MSVDIEHRLSSVIRVLPLAIGLCMALAVALGLAATQWLPVQTAKYLTAALLVAVFAISPFRIISSGQVLFLVLLSFFPITLSIMGKDAISVSTILILGTAAGWAMLLALSSRPVRLYKGIWLGLLVAIAAYSVLRSPAAYISPQVRHFLNFLSGVLLFLMLVNAPRLCSVSHSTLARRLLYLLVAGTCIQVLAGMVVYFRPDWGGIFSVFLPRTQEELVLETTLIRLRGLSMSVEELGEYIAMLMPLVTWLGLRRKGWIHWLAWLVLVAGLLLSNTRSAILLSLFGCGAIFAAGIGQARLRHVASLGAILAVAAILLLTVARPVADSVERHMTDAMGRRARGGDLVQVINRHAVWPDAWRVTRETLSLFGNGPAPSLVLGLNDKNMHNLYLTLIFQFGIVGAAIYLALFLSIGWSLLQACLRQNPDRLFQFACLISLCSFLVNEVKFEFNRADAYQQAVWAMLALYLLAAQCGKIGSQEPIAREALGNPGQGGSSG